MAAEDYTEKCSNCGKVFRVVIAPMGVPGGKMREEINCPYCYHENGSCMTDGFVRTYKIEP